jgi:tetratricopeptide (TPR) repeat protein
VNELLFGAGENGFGFHAPNVLFHAAASVLLFAWLARLPLRAPVPFVAALLFAVHPIHVEVVANVFGRSESMALVFGLGFLIAHGSGRAIVASLLYLLAMWSKESGVIFLGVALLADLLLQHGKSFPIRRHAMYAATLGLWIALRALALRGAVAQTELIDNPAFGAPAIERILTAAAVQLDYLRLLAWPLRQSADYSFAEREVVASALDPRVLGFVAVLAVALLAAVRWRRRAPAVLFAVAGYAVAFSVASNVLFPIGTIEGERLAYTPSLFFLLLAALLVRPVPLAPAISLSLGAAIAIALGTLTVRQSRIWKDEPTLFREIARTAPRSAKARLSLGTQLELEGDAFGAIREYETATRIAPDYAYAWVVLGKLRARSGDLEAAALAWERALEIDPRFSDARADLAAVLLDLARRSEAAAQVRELFARDLFHPRLAELEDRLAGGASPAELRDAREEFAEARAALAARDEKRAIARAQELAAGPTLPAAERAQALLLLADAWERLGQAGRAAAFRKAAERRAESGVTRGNLRR